MGLAEFASVSRIKSSLADVVVRLGETRLTWLCSKGRGTRPAGRRIERCRLASTSRITSSSA